MIIFAIDPGTYKSAWVNFCDGKPKASGISPNEELLEWLISSTIVNSGTVVIEMIASYGLPVGAEVFQTVLWIGRFIQAVKGKAELVYRKDVKITLCNSVKAKDANIRQALIDRYGTGRQNSIGTKKNPGPLYGIRCDEWAALAVAVTYMEKIKQGGLKLE